MTNNLQIFNTTIRQNKNGLYCLNDLHRASGGLDKNKPSNWLRLEQTKKYIQYLDRCSLSRSGCIINTQEGSKGGTYACEYLIKKYSEWLKKPTSRKPSHVYVVQCGGLVKIGITSNLSRRFKSIQYSCGKYIEKSHTINNDDAAAIEKKLHSIFYEYRTIGEWFDVDYQQVIDRLLHVEPPLTQKARWIRTGFKQQPRNQPEPALNSIKA